MFDDVYKGKTVLVTGHTGFKGSWLCIWLKELGANVVGYSLDPPSDPNNFNACHLNSHVTHIHGDIRNFTSVKKALEQHQPEFVFHLAAQALVRPSYRDPKQTFDTNVGGTVNILEAVRLTPGVKVLLNITSDKCYENREWIWGYRENDAMGGSDPYSASKGCSELVFSSYLRSFFNARVSARQIGAVSCRAGNAIGGGDWGENRLIPDCIKALSTGHTIDIRNPLSIRPWQHVLELLSGYLWLGRRLREEPDVYSGSWNFGPGRSEKFTVADIADCLIQCWGSGKWHDTSDPKTVHEAAVLKLCCDKANNLLNWRNTLSMHQSVKLTTEWYKEFYKDPKLSDMHKYCVNQIQYYTSLAQAGRLPWAMNP